MIKASWTKCCGVGGGAWTVDVRWSLRKGRPDGLGGRLEWDLSPLARSILEAASSVVGKRGSQNGDIRVSGQVTDPLRHAGPRPLAEKRRPLAAAVGATRAVRVIVMLVAQLLAVVDLGKLAQGFEQVRDLHRADRVSWLIKNQQLPCPIGQVSFRVVPQSVFRDTSDTPGCGSNENARTIPRSRRIDTTARPVLRCSRPRCPKVPFFARASSHVRIARHTRERTDGRHPPTRRPFSQRRRLDQPWFGPLPSNSPSVVRRSSRRRSSRNGSLRCV